jgi:hypothetical protein
MIPDHNDGSKSAGATWPQMVALTGKCRRDCGWRGPEWANQEWVTATGFFNQPLFAVLRPATPPGWLRFARRWYPSILRDGTSDMRRRRQQRSFPKTTLSSSRLLLQGTCSREACACHFRMQKASWKRRGAQKCSTQVVRDGSQKPDACCLTHGV